jgi:hypothetical protein
VFALFAAMIGEAGAQQFVAYGKARAACLEGRGYSVK